MRNMDLAIAVFISVFLLPQAMYFGFKAAGKRGWVFAVTGHMCFIADAVVISIVAAALK